MSVTFTYDALGTKWWIELFETIAEERLTIVKDDCEAFATDFEANYSRFKSDSLITRLNTQRTLSKPPTELIEMLRYGKELYLQTDTKFNILTGHIQEAKGYDADYSFVDSDTIPLPGNPITDLNVTADEISLSGISKVDLGGFGKGYLIDQLAQRLQTKHKVQFFLINGGGDIFATSNKGQPIPIRVEHPTNPKRFGSTTLLNEAFAASSRYKRKWHTSSGEHNHIIGNSKTGSFVKAARAVEADAQATIQLL
jgi:thiamine biosynthesis lipoprotein